jgi:hypothetical protein
MAMVLPEIRFLQAAIALAEELSFSRAAERLRVEQSTLRASCKITEISIFKCGDSEH